MRTLARFALASALAGLVACSLTSLDGYSSGGVAPGPSDAGPAGDGGIADAGDAAPADGGSAFCASKAATFCSDFDDVSPLAKWSSVQQAGAGSVAVDDLASVSPPSSVVVAVKQSAADSASCLRKDFGATNGATTFRVEAQIFIEQPGSSTNFDLARLYRSEVNNLGFEVSPSGTFNFDEDVPPDGSVDEIRTPTTAKISVGRWTPVVMTVVLQGSVAVTKVFVDGAEVGTTNASDQTFRGNLSLELGDCALSAVAASPWRIRFDDVVFDMK